MMQIDARVAVFDSFPRSCVGTKNPYAFPRRSVGTRKNPVVRQNLNLTQRRR